MSEEILPFGAVNFADAVVDTFYYEDVKEGHCVATVANNICKSLLETAYLEGTKYLVVCCPAYNEEVAEMMKTLLSTMRSFHFMKVKSKKYREFSDAEVQKEFQSVVPVLVPIFDGTKALSESMKEWIGESFPGVLENLEGKSEPGTPDVRIHCNKWWYYGGKKQKKLTPEIPESIRVTSQIEDSEKNQRLSVVLTNIFEKLNMRSNSRSEAEEEEEREGMEMLDLVNNMSQNNRSRNATNNISRENIYADALRGDDEIHQDLLKFQKQRLQGTEINNEDVMYFYMCPIIKKSNHRKHNSHQWFFDSICEGLEEKVTYAFLTDCGTSYEAPSLSYMLRELYCKDDLVGVTARQRIERPNRYFRPCEDSPFPCFRGDHSVKQEACWKCWATWILSACPLQEFEASSILSLAMFSMVECLPVMPGPCQMMNWQKMKQYHVVDEYFNLLFESENQHKLPPLPPGLKLMSMNSRDFLINSNDDGDDRPARVRHSLERKSLENGHSSADASSTQVNLTFTEFLRVNMRLVEDRILSFVSVFSTGAGTKWVAGATFHYQPEILWSTLLTQRRRWINGTFCGYLFHFLSERARSRVRGGLIDNHKPGRSQTLVDGFFALQVVQLIMVVICPSIFALAGYLGMTQCAKIYPDTLGFLEMELFTPYVRPIELWTTLYFIILGGWIFLSYHAQRGKIPEWLCQFMIVYGFIYTIPVHFVIWYSIFVFGPGIVGSVVIVNVAMPLLIAIVESRESAFQYIAFMPTFIVTGVFFLVYLPQYSFARLWDTTWGNRATPKDSAINDSMEDYMKRQNVILCCFTFVLNIFLFYSFLQIFGQGVTAIIAILFVMLAPTFVQMLISSIYIFLILPVQKCMIYINAGGRGGKKKKNDTSSSNAAFIRAPSVDLESNHGGGGSVTSATELNKGRSLDDLGIDYDDEGIFDVKSGTEFMSVIFPENSNQGNSKLHEEMINALHAPVMDQKSFWATPGSSQASKMELQEIIEEDKVVMSRTSSAMSLLQPNPPSPLPASSATAAATATAGGATSPYDMEFAYRNSLNSNADSRRSSKRLEVAGRYSRV